MPQLQPGEYTKQSAGDMLGWNSVPDLPQPGTARFYYNSLNGTIHCIDSAGNELLGGNGAVSSVNGKIGVVVLTATDVGAVSLTPSGDQTITGAHSLILNSPLAMLGIGITPTSPLTVTGTAGTGIFDPTAAIASSGDGTVQRLGLFVDSAVQATTTDSHFHAAIYAENTVNVSAGKTQARAIGLLTTSNSTGPGTITGLIGLDVFGPTVSAGSIVSAAVGVDIELNFGTYGGNGGANPGALYGIQINNPGSKYTGASYYGLLVGGGGTAATANYAVYVDNQGFNGSSDYALFVQGTQHNNLGGGYTKVGSIAITSTTASTTSNIGLNAGIIEATGGVGGITLTTQSTLVPIGQVYTVKKVDSGVGAVTLQDSAGANFDGDSTYVLSDQWQYVTIQWNGTRWNVIGNN